MGKVGFGVAVGIAAVSCAVAAAVVGKRVRSRRKWMRVVGVLKELEEGCGTPVSRLKHVVDAMAVEMHAGLASERGSKLKMLLTFVDKLPTGSEKGIYYALDLGGTNFRVLRVQLGGRRSGIVRHDVERKPIPEHLMTSTSEDLFDFIATSLKAFFDQENVKDSDLSPSSRRELGFTFSFPVNQTTVSSGILMKWTKGFSIHDMVGKDVSESLHQAMSRQGLNMHIAALVNDTVGTLALGHYNDEDTVAAVIIGTGTNACYFERADAIIKSQGFPDSSGGMGFEKMISGMYLGEIVRRVILRMSKESDVFGPISSSLCKAFILRTPLMSTMHEDESPDLQEVARILDEVLGIHDVPLKVRKLVVNICDVVTRRAARLAAAGIVGILKKIGRDGSGGVAGSRAKGPSSSNRLKRTVVAVEGGLYSNYRMFREYLNDAVAEILGEELAPYVILKVAEDGSGIGAALLAATYSSPENVDT
ncbi:hexokinase-3 isoform X2 [Spinacia oleracea]|uniref:Phosphotransferase n=1 Tax=Spinacia oleracea TaxID=3562 RepID=A0A9R0I679_SPIOL|nr:hexokinase-3 isoform X2 [Spinacia oleracea]